MNTQKSKMKQELIDRYKFLYGNVEYILAPDYPFYHKMSKEKLAQLETLLLCSTDYPFNTGKNYIEKLKVDKDYLKSVRNGIIRKEKDGKKYSEIFEITMNIQDLLSLVYDYIESQNCDENLKKKKLEVIDEYYRISRYKNDGNIWNSGRHLNTHDIMQIPNYGCLVALSKSKKIINEIGIEDNNFIEAFSNSSEYKKDAMHLSEDEKKNVYLCFNDELAWDLSIKCLIDTSSKFKGCKNKTYIKESEIFVDENNNFCELCPNCGSIIKININLIPPTIQKRIIERSNKDKTLYKRMILSSELKSLERDSNIKKKTNN